MRQERGVAIPKKKCTSNGPKKNLAQTQAQTKLSGRKTNIVLPGQRKKKQKPAQKYCHQLKLMTPNSS